MCRRGTCARKFGPGHLDKDGHDFGVAPAAAGGDRQRNTSRRQHRAAHLLHPALPGREATVQGLSSPWPTLFRAAFIDQTAKILPSRRGEDTLTLTFRHSVSSPARAPPLQVYIDEACDQAVR